MIKLNGFDPLDEQFAKGLPERSVLQEATKREVLNILRSYTGYFDIFSEAIQNALDAIDERIKISGLTFQPRLFVDVDVGNQIIRIIDNGVGMDDEQFRYCFRPSVSFKSRRESRGHNRPLADAIAIGLREEPRIQVSTFHQLCDRRIRQTLQTTGRDLLDEAKAAYPGKSDKHLFEVQMPYALALSNELLDEKFGAIVVDEAQDFSDEYWFAIEELLSDQSSGYLYIFIDENQAIYPRHGNLPVAAEPYFLTSNCRNTAPIHDAGYAFYTGEPVDSPDLPGMAVERVGIDSDEAQADAIVRRVHRWVIDEALRPEDVAVLIAKRPKTVAYNLLQLRGQAAGIIWSMEIHGRARQVLVDTVARFKGLEAQAIVLWIGDEVVSDKQWESMYVGTTRAKFLLTVVGSKGTINALRAN